MVVLKDNLPILCRGSEVYPFGHSVQNFLDFIIKNDMVPEKHGTPKRGIAASFLLKQHGKL